MAWASSGLGSKGERPKTEPGRKLLLFMIESSKSYSDIFSVIC